MPGRSFRKKEDYGSFITIKEPWIGIEKYQYLYQKV